MTDKEMEDELKVLADRLDLKDLSETFYFPKYFEIETIRACNARCKMCPIWQHPEEYGTMEQGLFDKILKELSEHSDWINSVCLSRNGEPLLDKDLENKIKKLKESGIKNVTFSTNALILDEKRAVSLIESSLDDIRFSIDGATKETFELIRQGLAYDTVLENCLRFIDIRNRLRGKTGKPKIEIRMVLQEENKHEEKQWKEFWLSKVSDTDIVYSKTMNTWGNQLQGYEKQADISKYPNNPCISPWSTMIILYDGKIPLCGVDYNILFNMGNLNDSTIKQIWQSENFQKIRNLHASGKRNEISLCPGCTIWDLERKKVYGGQT